MSIKEEINSIKMETEEDDSPVRIINLFTDLGGSDKIHLQLANGLLLFYVAVAGNFLGELFSKRMQRLLTENRWVKHLIAFITMMYSITFVTGITKLVPALTVTLIMYTWFVLSTKMFEWYNIALIFLLMIGFMMNKYADNLDPEEPQDKKTIEKLNKIQSYLFILGLVITVVGVVSYMQYQRKEYGSDFSVIKFLLK